MASTIDFIEYVCEQIDGKYSVRYKKMFGDYMIYVNDKPIFLVCNNCVYIKILDDVKELMISAERGIPYAGSKEHYILDVENRELINAVVEVLERITPIPKKKVKANK